MARILVTGGARSGKSAYAIRRAEGVPGARKFFIATAQALDDEMAARIRHHRANRPPEFQTLEEPLKVVSTLAASEDRADVIVLDCLTLWISNLMAIEPSDAAILSEADALAAAIRRSSRMIIVVTDEVGSGIVPDNPAARRFRDLLGWTNQKIANAADEVVMMVAGVPMRIK